MTGMMEAPHPPAIMPDDMMTGGTMAGSVGSSFMLPSNASTTTGLSGGIAKAAGNAPIPGSVT